MCPNVVKQSTKSDCPLWHDFDKVRYALFRKKLGSIAHVANWSRPDLAFAVSFVSQFMANPGDKHMHMVDYILGYLKNTKTLKITFKQSKNKV